jgi:hypothetical protein
MKAFFVPPVASAIASCVPLTDTAVVVPVVVYTCPDVAVP